MDDKKEIEELVLKLQDKKGRSIAFSRLMQLTQERIYWNIRKMVLNHDDANDVLQNTYMKAWRAIDNFRGDSQFFTWLYRISVNESLTFLSQQRIKNINSPLDLEDLLVSRMKADVYFDGNEAQEKLQKAILTLPEKQRLVFNMKYFDNMKYEDMSKILGTSEGALKASYHIAVKKIEAILREED